MSHQQEQSALDLARDQAMEWSLRLEMDASDETLHDAFEEWLDHSDLHLQAWRDLAELDSKLDEAFIPTVLNMSIEELKKPHTSTSGMKRRLYMWGVPAALAAVLLFFIWAPSLLLLMNSDYWNRGLIPQEVILGDGTRVTLAADTAIRIELNEAVRDVHLLRGEAVFEVARDPSKPFHVYGSNTTVSVLGTVFNVALLDEKVSLGVNEGHVEFSSSHKDSQVHSLYASDWTAFYSDGRTDHRKLKVGEFAPWLKGKIIADNVPVVDLIHQLQRYSSAKIVVMNDQIANARVTGIFDLTKPEQALEAVAVANDGQLTNLGLAFLIR